MNTCPNTQYETVFSLWEFFQGDINSVETGKIFIECYVVDNYSVIDYVMLVNVERKKTKDSFHHSVYVQSTLHSHIVKYLHGKLQILPGLDGKSGTF